MREWGGVTVGGMCGGRFCLVCVCERESTCVTDLDSLVVVSLQLCVWWYAVCVCVRERQFDVSLQVYAYSVCV